MKKTKNFFNGICRFFSVKYTKKGKTKLPKESQPREPILRLNKAISSDIRGSLKKTEANVQILKQQVMPKKDLFNSESGFLTKI